MLFGLAKDVEDKNSPQNMLSPAFLKYVLKELKKSQTKFVKTDGCAQGNCV